MIRYRLLQRKEKGSSTNSEYWFSLALAVQQGDGIYIRQWGRIPFATKKKRLEGLNLLDVPKSLRSSTIRWTEVRMLSEEYPLWTWNTMKVVEPVEQEVIDNLLPEIGVSR